jgi:hypothetical protein
MTSLQRFREALASQLGQVLTPEACVAIERQFFADEDRAHDPAKFGVQACGSLTFQAERFALILPELHPLHEAHWLETEKHRHGLRLNPDYEALLADERAGRMLQFTARCDGELVGNLRVYLGESRHTRTLFAIEDTLYLLPHVRRGRNAVRFIRYGEDCLRAIGVREIRCTAKTVNGTARLFEKCGYTPVATELVKFLED